MNEVKSAFESLRNEMKRLNIESKKGDIQVHLEKINLILQDYGLHLSDTPSEYVNTDYIKGMVGSLKSLADKRILSANNGRTSMFHLVNIAKVLKDDEISEEILTLGNSVDSLLDETA